MRSACARRAFGMARRMLRTSRSPSASNDTATRKVRKAARTPSKMARPARVIGAVFPDKRLGRSSIQRCAFSALCAFCRRGPMPGRSFSCRTIRGNCDDRLRAWWTAGGPRRANRATTDRKKALRTMAMATGRLPPRRCCVASTSGLRASASSPPMISAVRVRGAERTRPVSAISPTKAPSSTAMLRQSRSTVRTDGGTGTASAAGSGASPASTTSVLYRAMAEPQPTERLRISSRSAIAAVALLGATLVALRMVEASTRVIGWLLAAIAVASLVHPLVAWLSRAIPRAVAVLLVVIVVLGGAGLIGYSLVHAVVSQTHHLQEAAPVAAAKLERSKRYGDLARQFKLTERTKRFVDTVPQRLQGGSPAEAIRAAATRGVAFLATGVLTLFFLSYGPTLAS